MLNNRKLVLFQFYYISIFVCFSHSKGSSNSEFEDEDNSDVSIIISSDNENHDSDEISDIFLDSDKQIILSILIFDSSNCISSQCIFQNNKQHDQIIVVIA